VCAAQRARACTDEARALHSMGPAVHRARGLKETGGSTVGKLVGLTLQEGGGGGGASRYGRGLHAFNVTFCTLPGRPHPPQSRHLSVRRLLAQSPHGATVLSESSPLLVLDLAVRERHWGLVRLVHEVPVRAANKSGRPAPRAAACLATALRVHAPVKVARADAVARRHRPRQLSLLPPQPARDVRV